MGRFKPVDYNQNLLLNVVLERQVVPGTIEWAIHHLIEDRLDLSAFYVRYKNDYQGRPAYDPRVLLKVVLLSYARGVLTSRKMEQMCRENVVFMALTCGVVPDHSTLASFISSMGDLASALFVEVLLVCEQEGLLAGTHVSIDGTKLSSNASKEWSGKFADLQAKSDKIHKLIDELMAQHQHADAAEDTGDDADARRLAKLRKSAAYIDTFLDSTEKREGSSGNEIQSNVTDNEAAHMSTSHGVLVGYNANAAVDDKHQVIVAAGAYGCGTDHGNLVPMLALTEENLRMVGTVDSLRDMVVTADTSYFSKVNLQACDERQVDAYIPDPHFRKRDPQLRDPDRHRRKTVLKPDKPKPPPTTFSSKDFIHEPDQNRLRCPAGKYLYSNGSGHVQHGRHTHKFKAPLSACAGCKLRSKCLRHPERTKVRQVQLTGDYASVAATKNPTLAQKMREKIDTLAGRATYRRRLGIVEPVFANLSTHKGMGRFTLRGKEKVTIQWLCYCLVHNIGKIARYGQLAAG